MVRILLAACVALSSEASRLGTTDASATNISGSAELTTNSCLCRCQLEDGPSETKPFADCHHVGYKQCFTKAEVNSRLKSIAKKMNAPEVAKMNVNCMAISINGEVIKNQNYATIINSDRAVPEGLPVCSPGYFASADQHSTEPLQVLANYIAGQSSSPVADEWWGRGSKSLGKECMYCEGKRGDAETQCCTAVSDFTGLELPKQCRYPVDIGGVRKYYTAISKSDVDRVISEGRDPGELCCSGRAIYSLSRQWECRNEIGNDELLWQMKEDGIDRDYRKMAFHRYMWDVYREKVLPMEEATMFGIYDTFPMTSGEITQKPLVMLVGPYSSGKTTFINHVLGENYPGSVVGVEPTTNMFTVVQSGENKKVPGFALTADPNNHFQGVARELGIEFQRNFEASQLKNPILNDLTFLDTPGVLSGAKQSKRGRGYDFNKAIDFFAERADVILVFFDVYRMDLSDEMGQVLRTVTREGRHKKVRIVLNKADMIPADDLMRVYGTIMWYTSQLARQSYVPQVHIGNFGGFEYKNTEFASFFDENREKLYNTVLKNIIPAKSATTKVDRFIERLRRLKAHALLFDQMRTTYKKSWSWAKKKAQQRIIADLPSSMQTTAKRKGINIGDFQPHEQLAEKLELDKEFKFAQIPALNKKTLAKLDEALNSDLPRLVASIRTTYGVDLDELTEKTFGQ